MYTHREDSSRKKNSKNTGIMKRYLVYMAINMDARKLELNELVDNRK